MKIAYFLDISQGLGGAGNLLLQQARLMSDIHNVIVVIPMNPQGMPNDEYAKRCERYGLPYYTLRYSTSFNFNDIDWCQAMDSVSTIMEFSKNEKISFFHSVQLNVAVEYVARKLGIPHLMNIYQLREEDFACCPGDIFPHFHLCDSNIYKERWSRKLGIESRCVRPVALLDVMKKKERYPKGNIKILMLGSVCERKNQLAAIKACELCLKEYEIVLTIAGDLKGSYAKSCIDYVKERHLERSIIFKGFVSDIVPLLGENDCLLCTSTDESFPSSMVEALTYDLTIMSTPVAGVPEIFVNGYNAFVSKDFSVESISFCIKDCIRNYKIGDICQIHEQAEATWNNNFERNRVRKQIDLYYDRIKDAHVIYKDEYSRIMSEVKRTIEILNEEYNRNVDMQKRALYHTLLRKELTAGVIYLWGAGKMGQFAYDILRVICPKLTIKAFVDKKKEGQYCGLPIIKPEELPIDENIFYGIAFVEGSEEVIDGLNEKGLILNRQIWRVP